MTPSRKVGTRCLAIMEQLAGGVGDSGRGLMLADALMPLLQQSAASRYARTHARTHACTHVCTDAHTHPAQYLALLFFCFFSLGLQDSPLHLLSPSAVTLAEPLSSCLCCCCRNCITRLLCEVVTLS